MSIATVALGLRMGAGDPMRAAIVVGAGVPRSPGGTAWQLRTQEDDGFTRTAISIPATVKLTSRSHTVDLDLQTNLDGVAELPFKIEGFATGDAVHIDVRDKSGAVLAQGDAAWPKEILHASVASDVALRAARAEGDVKMSVAVFGGALAPGQAGRVFVHAQTGALGVNVDASPDLGLEIASPYHASTLATCPHDGFIEVIARGLSGGVTLRAKDSEEKSGDWYGALPVVPGAMYLVAPSFSPAGPVPVSITSAGARTMAYVEVDDDLGRESALTVPLAGEPPHADVTLDVRTPGKNLIVVSGDSTGAEAMSGATRAFPIWITRANETSVPCEMVLAKSAAYAFPRFIALDGFVEKRAARHERRKKGRMLAFIGLALGSLLETLLLLRAARDGKRELEKVQNAIIAEGNVSSVSSTRRWGLLDALAILVVSLLGFALLFAFIETMSR